MLNTIKFVILVNVLCLAYGLPLPQYCGKSFNTSSTPNWRVVGGTDATEGEFPWQIILTLAKENTAIPDANNFCGGTIIDERWILTAGHCIHLRTESSLKIRLGVHNFKAHEDREVNIFVEKIVPHEHFVQTLFTVQNDLALVKLSQSLDFSGKHKHLSPICLATSETKLTNKCVASGFGFINAHRQRPVDGVLQKVDEPFAETSHCKKYFVNFNEAHQVCAGGLTHGGKAVCNGDSGGPLQCQAADGSWHQVGIVSYGKPCALPNVPDVFTKVSAYVDWIEKTVSSH